MRLSSVHDEPRKLINGSRPSPLMINRDSHLIRKPSVSVAETKLRNQQQRRDPIIIYTHSPKVIHTKAQDFMALVQRLTGMSPSNNEEASENFGSSLSDGSNNSSIKKQGKQGASDHGDEITSSAFRNHQTADVIQQSPFSMGFAADMPLFTPNSSEFFFPSSRSVYKYSDSPFGILGSLISPSGLEFIKELPEY